MRPAPWQGAAAVSLAVVVFAVTVGSPVVAYRSDPALGLLAAQALLDHGSTDLAPYVGDPRLGLDLTTDRRVVRRDGGVHRHDLGLAVVAAPAVAVARLAGLDMRRPEDEAMLQNLLSALCAAAVALLVFALCRRAVAPAPALAIAAVTCLGSGLVSTLGTALWNVTAALPFLCAALWVAAGGRLGVRRGAGAGLLLLLAAAIRPSLGLVALALPASLPARPRRRRAALLAVALGLLALALVGGRAVADAAVALGLPAYYAPARLVARQPAGTGLVGLLISPSRGLLVFSPFLLVVVAALARHRGSLWREPLVRLTVVWSVLLAALAAGKGMWWGGHGYGPRLLVELMPAWALVAAHAWRRVRAEGPRRVARRWAVAYLALAAPAVAIHAGKGLFDPAVKRWNEVPNVDVHPELVFDPRHPQFLASDEGIDRRLLQLERPWLAASRPGERLGADDPRLVYLGWHPAEPHPAEPAARQREGGEPAFRWSRRARASLVLELRGVEAERPHRLELDLATLEPAEVAVAWNGEPLGHLEGAAGALRRYELAVRPGLVAPGENRVDLAGPPARRPAASADPRRLGLRFGGLRLSPFAAGEAR